ncbi:T6SS phospholipase effector Tle1-like catalytic domain-containing protein [Natronohydrobacter thiooxidans]|uniref:T6SS phospholipase effector Tle1-like catalytic domain-containing protein n=1 Tax=Natronohydrobacter thiooxidans TaxID=87172 RepID=UPI0008FF148D|nr:DUF2235 domain-containing protein [Natronohydrobacter thiooxidans]
MTKTIILLFDGTANTVRSNRSNILRLYGCLEKSDRQLVWYSPGVGTFGGENSLFYWRARLREVFDRATGWGLDRNVKDAYRFLVENYDNGKRDGKRVQPRDRVVLFGFSRGAYTARVLAGFLNAFGLMAPRHLNLLDQAYRAYKGVAERPDARGDWEEMDLWYRVLRPDLVPIACLGLFDTVSSVFEWGRNGPRFRAHANTSENPSVAAVRHAVALDERRALYQPLHWPGGQICHGNRFRRGPGQPQDLREMWFAGVHADVGGGYPEHDSALGKVALDWMIRETEALGVQYRWGTVKRIVLGRQGDGPSPRYVAPDPGAPAQNSLSLLWKLTGFLPRRGPPALASFGLYLPLWRRRRVGAADLVHASVAGRQGSPHLASPNLPEDPNYQP